MIRSVTLFLAERQDVMAGDNIIECGVNFLSFERALKLVPPEFRYAYDWFQEHEGETFSRLPMGKYAPDLEGGIKLFRQSGIFTPSYANLASGGNGKERYVLSIHSQGSSLTSNAPYPDMDVIRRPDGTWTFDYSAHRSAIPGTRDTQGYNQDMMNNLRDGVPIAVFVQYPRVGYVNYGLAYIERYDVLTGMFTLHGPVSAEGDNADFCSIVPFGQLTNEEKQIFLGADAGDDRKRVLAEQVRREKQSEFRKMLLEAYSGSCAVTKVDVPEVLQAAHIDPYRGKKSQMVTNGMLLRSDIHLLYDSHLLTVQPERNLIRVSKRLEGTFYGQLDGQRIRVPDDPQLRPNDELLDMHMREFEQVEKHLGAA